MFDKKRALICAVIFNTLAAASFITAMALPDSVPEKIGVSFIIYFIVFLVAGMSMLIVYARKKNQEKVKAALDAPRDWAEFDEWLKNFEPFVRFGAVLTETSEKVFTKFGGLPEVPTGFVWPTHNGRPLPFLFQVDFSEVNPQGKLNDFPTEGVMYIFADSDEINDPNFADGEEEFAQGRAFQILFYEKRDGLITAEKPDLSDAVYKEFHVASEAVKTYPDVDDCRAACDIYCDRPVGGMDDGYDELQGENIDSFMLGGWASYIQSSPFAGGKAPNPEEWVLLMQVASVNGDEKFTWGDGGTLYFYIRKSDLLARRFDGVKLEMQCY